MATLVGTPRDKVVYARMHWKTLLARTGTPAGDDDCRDHPLCRNTQGSALTHRRTESLKSPYRKAILGQNGTKRQIITELWIPDS